MLTNANAISSPPSTHRSNKPRNIQMPSVGNISWTQSNVMDSLDSVRRVAEEQAQSAINWYYEKKRPMALASRMIRLLVIMLTTIGGLIPIVANLPHLQPSWMLEKWGYVALASAAACIGLDKYFGFSTGWIRYITTAQTLQKELCEFQWNWERFSSKLTSNPSNLVQMEEMLQLAHGLSNCVMQAVTQETQQWIEEFQRSLTELEMTTKAQLKSSLPGSLTIVVDNADFSDQPVSVDVDGVFHGSVVESVFTLHQIPPGCHTVLISGSKDGAKLQGAGTVVVPIGGTSRLNLRLKTSDRA